MSLFKHLLLTILLLTLVVDLFALSDTLLAERFDNCVLPSGWDVQIDGNQDVVWYIGTPLNPSSDSSSMDGSCMVIIDDDATGENTSGFTWSMTSPYFDMTGYSTVNFSADVHMRTYDLEQFTIYLEDEQGRRVIQRLEGRNYGGTQFSQFISIQFDLVFFDMERARLVFEYKDNDTWGWWAGFDNVVVNGSGSGNVILLENFNECSSPEGWTSLIESGSTSWQVGIVDNSNAGSNNTLNGSCFLYFDDDGTGQDAAPSQVTMISPPFNGTQYGRYEAQFDMIYRTYSDNEYLEIGVLNSRGYHPIRIISAQVGGELFTVYENMTVDLSEYKDEQIQIYFRYDDGSSWNWWVGIDNVKVIGEGEVNDFCSKSLVAEENICHAFDMQFAYAANDVSFACNDYPSATLWYSYYNPEERVLEIAIQGGNFNDVVEVFKGTDCSQLELVFCQDRDEYGFTGEQTRYSLSAGQYYVRVSGRRAEFGKSKGMGCLVVREVDQIISPAAHGNCGEAYELQVEMDCIPLHNKLATNPSILPSANSRARADVWLRFIPEEKSDWKIHTGADFADMITVYSGNCQQLEEYQSNEQGLEMTFTDMEIGEAYFIQWSGYFSSLEGQACIHIEKVEQTEVPDDCFTAMPIVEGTSPVLSNISAEMSDRLPECDPLATADVWYRFVPEVSGAVYVRNKSDFISTLSIYVGNCDSLSSIYCDRLNHGCDGYTRVPALQSGTTYFVQIASRGRVPGQNNGRASFEWKYAQDFLPYEPLTLQADAICVSKNAAVVTPVAEGGSGSYFFESNAITNTLFSLEEFFLEVTDTDGCVAFINGIVPDCSEADCNVFFDAQVVLPTCHNESDGAIELAFTGGVGPYWYDLDGIVGESELIGDLSPGEYVLSLADAGGCSETFHISIPNPDQLGYDLLLAEQSSGQDGVIQIEVTGGSAPYEIIWYRDGSITDLKGLLINNLSPAVYQAYITDSNGCLLVSESIEVELSTSTSDPTPIAGLRIFPNPADNELNLAFKANFLGHWNMNVLDRLGRTVISDAINLGASGSHQLHLETLSPGIYFLQLSRDEIAYTFKFVKI